MAQLMLVNPKRRKRRAKAKTAAKRRDTTAAKRAAPKRRYRRNPIGLGANPAKRRSRRRYRRNPIGMKGIMAPILPAFTSATGAIGLDLAWGIIGPRLPAGLGDGPLKHVAKAAGALGLGMLAGMVVSKGTANQLVTGALTVVMHGAMKDTIQKTMPGVTLGESEYGMDGLAEYLPDTGMGEYLPEMGEYLPEVNGVGYSGGGEYFDGLGANEYDNVFSL